MSFKKMYKRIFCAIYNKIKELLQFIMLKYLKYFTKHEDYTEYINGLNKVLPNVSFCEDNKEIHYLSGKDVFTKFNPTIGLVRFLYIDDFPTDVCENKYGNDMAAFKQDFINNLDKANEYKYTGETLEYEGNEYYLWEYQVKVDDDSNYRTVKYILTDRLDFTGHSLEENINSDYCPFITYLNEDKDAPEGYAESDFPDTYLIASRSGVKLVNDVDNISEIIIDGKKLPSVVEYYDFGDDNEHSISFTFKNNTRIDDDIFNGCIGLTSVEIPKTVTYIGYDAFKESGLTGNLIIPNNVTQINEDAFNSCVNLTNVSIPESVESIPDGTFQDCSGLTEIVLHDKIIAIGDSAFAGCSSVQSITILAEEPPTLGPLAFDTENNCPIYVPAESVQSYKEAFSGVHTDYSSRIQAIPTT